VGTTNVGSHAPAWPPFIVALRERRSTVIHDKRPRSGCGSNRFPDPEITFLTACWDIIQPEVLVGFQWFHAQLAVPLPKLNGAHITLLPKKVVSEEPSDFRLISLIHSFAKLISKVMALRLAPLMDDLVSSAQSDFIKHHCIQDNFLYVRNLACAYHRKKTLSLLLKLDISKAFDSVSWEYIFEMLQH
jgi:hypothetical protein